MGLIPTIIFIAILSLLIYILGIEYIVISFFLAIGISILIVVLGIYFTTRQIDGGDIGYK